MLRDGPPSRVDRRRTVPPSIPARIRQSPALLRNTGALGCYLALTLGMTFPLALQWRSALPAGAGDVWQNYWNLWWWKKCLLEGLDPLRSEWLFHPFGADLVFHTHSPFNQIVSMPVNLAFGEAAAYNFCVILALTLAGFGMYLFVRELTGSAASGFLAGLVFAYFPQTIEQTLEHLNLFSIQFIPLSLFYMLRWTRSGRTVDALALGACFGLNALCSWHLGLKLGIILTPWALWHVYGNRDRLRRAGKDLACGAALAVLLVVPLLAPMGVLMTEGNEYRLKYPVSRGIDASFLLTPTYANPIAGPAVRPRYADRAYQAAGFVCYLGFLPAALAALGAARGGRRALPWLGVIAGGVVLALGSDLLWNGTRYDQVPLPFSALGWIPLLESLRVANRFMVVASVGLAVLAGLGWSVLRWKHPAALALVAVFLLAEYSWLPFPMQDVRHSPLLEQVRSRPGAVLDIPFHQRNRSVHNMVNQTVHGRPIAGGYLSTYPPEVERSVEGDRALSQLAGVPGPDARVDVARLLELGFATVVVHKNRAASAREKALAELPDTDILRRKHALRIGGVPDDTLASLRSQLDEATGGAAMEDELLAIYFLK